MASVLDDARVAWIRQRVVLSLDIPTESFDEYFTESLERARSAGIAKEQILSWLSESHTAGSSLFFAATKKEIDKEIEEEVEVEDEGASEEKKGEAEFISGKGPDKAKHQSQSLTKTKQNK